MKKIKVFMMVSLDGFVEGPNHDISWHTVDEEFNEFASKQMIESDMFLFGRRTYQLMESYWPTETPSDPADAVVAEQMNRKPKIVVSNTMKAIQEQKNWENVRLINKDVVDELRKLKDGDGEVTVFGSNNLCVTLIENNLLDKVRIMISPTIIGAGTPLFKGLKNKLEMKLTSSKIFKNGNILLDYSLK